MKAEKNVNVSRRHSKKTKSKDNSLHSLFWMMACTIGAVVFLIGFRISDSGEKNKVYAAESEEIFEADSEYLPSGISGVVSGVQETPVPGTTINRIGTSCEQVMVGQRVNRVENSVTTFNVSTSMENKVNDLESRSEAMAQSAKLMSDEDYDTLLRIVEAEAGTEDVKGRIMVANVIMNRVNTEGFPDTVTDVVWDYVSGVPQFSPVYDGRINTVTVTDETREAVKQALEGVDYSEGALFFIMKSAAEEQNIEWFERDLKKLFKYGVHEFYTYPSEEELAEREAQAEKEQEQQEAKESLVKMEENSEVIQMVKN